MWMSRFGVYRRTRWEIGESLSGTFVFVVFLFPIWRHTTTTTTADQGTMEAFLKSKKQEEKAVISHVGGC